MVLRGGIDDLAALRMSDAVGCWLRCLNLRRMAMEGFAGVVATLAAGSPDSQCKRQIVEAGAAALYSAGDAAIGDRVADANRHE